jgi:predicted RNA-binding Zn-ribbon protein involved in translation (DUF1610 family)
MELIPFVIGAVIIWLYISGRNKINDSAPHCSKCGTKMKLVNSNPAYRRQRDPTDPWTQYGNTLWKYRCPSCGAEKIQ